MNIKEYTEWTRSTAIYPSDSLFKSLNYTVLGLSGEAGEIANKFKKIIRDGGGDISTKNIEDISDELGDVLWYVARIADELGITLEELAEKNKSKLSERKSRNKISGSGDHR